jgi:peptidoglycan pentaglycine glycine transferase (the first glycine)
MLPNNPSIINPLQWNSIVARLPGAHVLQSWEWGKVKSEFGWQPSYLLWVNDNNEYKLLVNHYPLHFEPENCVGAALTLQRNINIGGFARKMGVIYIPKGPLCLWEDTNLRQHILRDIKAYSQKHNAIFIKIDPDLQIGIGVPGEPGAAENNVADAVISELKNNGWQFSDEQVQYRNTVIIDLDQAEEEILANMKQKTRYNINLAKRKGVVVRLGSLDDIDELYQMYAETSVRDGFVIRNEGYYKEVWNTFLFSQGPKRFDQPVAEALIAEMDGAPIAGVIIFRFARKAWYLYGMSRSAHRDKMPNYLLQWEAIKRAKAAGCLVYDLWGAPDDFTESDPLWGVYRFKDGLGGTVHRHLGAWDFPVNRMLYRLYTKTLPGLLDIMRQRGKASTKQVLG